MIRRLLVREMLSFPEVQLEFVPGLVVFTGPSGAGKSLLMQAILANLGYGGSEAKLCEIEMERPPDMESEDLLLGETLTIRALRKGRARYYLNDQHLSQRRLRELLAPYVHYLSVRDREGFETERLLEILDAEAATLAEDFAAVREEYDRRWHRYRETSRELERIRRQEREMAERMEFARFEIDRIAAIDPKEGEYEELLAVKQRLSRLDRIKETAQRAAAIFDSEESVEELFRLLDRDGSYFSEAMNQLRVDLEEVEQLADELQEIDVEGVLDRLEQLSSLIARHGSIAEALAHKAAKEAELAGYEHLEEDKSELEAFLERERAALSSLAEKMGKARRAAARSLEAKLAPLLERLKLPGVRFRFTPVALGEWGGDGVDLELEGSRTATLSGGEFNRLRLSLMSVAAGERGSRIIFLDEIDANVSGDESIAIAEMIGELARRHQVFAISHQPHLSARAHQHILVRKEGGVSVAESLEETGRIREIARIVSGEGADEEATAFATKLRKTAGGVS